MSQYHPDADPQFVAMHSHYEQQTNHFTEALFFSFDAAGFIALESDMADFWQSLWKPGFKSVPINEPPAINDEPLKYWPQANQGDYLTGESYTLGNIR